LRQTCFQSLPQEGEGGAASAAVPAVAVVANLLECGEQNACCGEEGDANLCHDQGSCAAKEGRNRHEEVAPSDETKNDLNGSVAVNYAEGEGFGKSKSCSRPPLLNIPTGPGNHLAE